MIAPTVLDTLQRSDGEPFGCLLEGGFIVALNGTMFAPITPAATPAEPEPAEPSLTDGTLNVPTVDSLRFAWRGHSLDAFVADELIASLSRSGSKTNLELHFLPRAYSSQVNLKSPGMRWAAEQEIAKAFDADATDEARLRALLLELGRVFNLGPHSNGNGSHA